MYIPKMYSATIFVSHPINQILEDAKATEKNTRVYLVPTKPK